MRIATKRPRLASRELPLTGKHSGAILQRMFGIRKSPALPEAWLDQFKARINRPGNHGIWICFNEDAGLLLVKAVEGLTGMLTLSARERAKKSAVSRLVAGYVADDGLHSLEITDDTRRTTYYLSGLTFRDEEHAGGLARQLRNRHYPESELEVRELRFQKKAESAA